MNIDGIPLSALTPIGALALTAPTNAQTLAEVKALARQNNGLIRLLLQRFDGTD